MSKDRFKKTEWVIVVVGVAVAAIWFVLFCHRLREVIWQH